MQRYFVCRAYFKWRGVMYNKGDLLPETFTHHDKARSIYNSRIGLCEVPDEVEQDALKHEDSLPPASEPSATAEGSDSSSEAKIPAASEVPQTGTTQAAKPFVFNFPNTTGTH